MPNRKNARSLACQRVEGTGSGRGLAPTPPVVDISNKRELEVENEYMLCGREDLFTDASS